MELADILLAINPDDSEAKNIKAKAADHFALTQTASNDYYFYKTVAGELRGEIDVTATNNKITPKQLRGTPMKTIMRSLPVNLNADKAIETNKKIVFKFLDINDEFGIHIRRGVAQLSFVGFDEPDLVVTTNQQTLKEIFAGLKNVASISLALTDGTIEVEG
jgi:alkyl sulfatase BDS1-like metallo-beta-lactamase superfamily hydrolase